jgi:hypothetical protein
VSEAMNLKAFSKSRLLGLAGAVAVVTCSIVPSAFAGDALVGSWTATITLPQSPGSPQTTTQTVTFNVTARGKSLVGRMTITDGQGREVAGVWREVGKVAYITYEPVCDTTSGNPCGTIILIGKIKPSAGIIVGQKAIIQWDVQNSQNPSLYDTSNGSFSAQATTQ